MHVTYREPSKPDSPDRPTPRYIEVTEAMLAAGLKELAGYSAEADSADETVWRIYEAMVRAKGV